MSLLPIIAGGLLLMASKGAKKEEDGDFISITPPGFNIPKPGQPNLRIDKVRKLLNRVDYSFSPDGTSYDSFKHKWKSGDIMSNRIGNYTVNSQTELVTNKKGGFDYGAVFVTVLNPDKTVRSSKKILVNEGKVYDIK